MKKHYIFALVKEPQIKNKNSKQKFINNLNLPEKRNNVKILFVKNVRLIKEKTNPNERKYYLNKLQKILKNYEKINEKEFSDEKNMQLDDDEEEVIDNQWIVENEIYNNNRKMFKLFTVMVPFAYIIGYLYINYK